MNSQSTSVENPEPQKLFANLLRSEYQKRRLVNSRLSLRAFARHLKVDSSHLSKIMRGDRPVSKRFVEWAGKSLQWTPEKINQAKAASDVSEAKAGRKLGKSSDRRFYRLSESEVKVASRWLHYIILEMTELSDFEPTPENIARRLRTSVAEIKLAIGRLKRVGAIIEFKPNHYRATRQFTSTNIPGTSSDLKSLQKEILAAASRALDEIEPGKREQSGILMAINSSRLPEAKERIKKFRREMMEFLEEGNKDQVYQLSLSLFPVSQA